MKETSKTKLIWTEEDWAFLKGAGIDIGCGNDPITPQARPFDLQHGDANEVHKHVEGNFDFVFSSHCLEHMRDPKVALKNWWKLVKPGGYLVVLVPDEDLYEQGVWPSQFNDDHKWTFTLSKRRSWSPVSVNVLELVKCLEGGKLIKAEVHDHHYDRSLQRFGWIKGNSGSLVDWLKKPLASALRKIGILNRDQQLSWNPPVDQTGFQDKPVLAQIQFVVQRV